MGNGPLIVRLGAAAALTARHGPRRARVILRGGSRRYVPPPDVAATASGRLNVKMGAYLLALRDAMRPDWEMEDVTGADGYAFDVRRCVLAEYMRSRGEEAFCREVICAQDSLMARARGDVLERAQTIAAGADRCTFRFQQPR